MLRTVVTHSFRLCRGPMFRTHRQQGQLDLPKYPICGLVGEWAGVRGSAGASPCGADVRADGARGSRGAGGPASFEHADFFATFGIYSLQKGGGLSSMMLTGGQAAPTDVQALAQAAARGSDRARKLSNLLTAACAFASALADAQRCHDRCCALVHSINCSRLGASNTCWQRNQKHILKNTWGAPYDGVVSCGLGVHLFEG